MAMILECDRSPNISPEQRINSLMASAQRALDDLENSISQIVVENVDLSKIAGVGVSFTEAETTTPIESGNALSELFGQIKKNQKDIVAESLKVNNIEYTFTQEQYDYIASLIPSIGSGGGLANLVDFILPVGHVITTTNASYNPNELFSLMTWERFAKGQTLVGVDEDDTDFAIAGLTGGSKDAILVEHNHMVTYSNYNRGSGSLISSSLADSARSKNTSTEGEDGTGKNLPPYQTVYFWRRTA